MKDEEKTNYGMSALVLCTSGCIKLMNTSIDLRFVVIVRAVSEISLLALFVPASQKKNRLKVEPGVLRWLCSILSFS